MVLLRDTNFKDEESWLKKAEALLFLFFKEEYAMELFIKFIDGEYLTIRDVSYYHLLEDFWKIVTNDNESFFFNKEQVKCIGNNKVSFY